MAFATMNASPPRTCRMRNAPPGRECAACEMLPLEGDIPAACEMLPPEGDISVACKMLPWKGNPPHAKCPTSGGDSLPTNFMLK